MRLSAVLFTVVGLAACGEERTSIPRGSILDDDTATPAEAGPAHHPNH